MTESLQNRRMANLIEQTAAKPFLPHCAHLMKTQGLRFGAVAVAPSMMKTTCSLWTHSTDESSQPSPPRYSGLLLRLPGLAGSQACPLTPVAQAQSCVDDSSLLVRLCAPQHYSGAHAWLQKTS